MSDIKELKPISAPELKPQSITIETPVSGTEGVVLGSRESQIQSINQITKTNIDLSSSTTINQSISNTLSQPTTPSSTFFDNIKGIITIAPRSTTTTSPSTNTSVSSTSSSPVQSSFQSSLSQPSLFASAASGGTTSSFINSIDRNNILPIQPTSSPASLSNLVSSSTPPAVSLGSLNAKSLSIKSSPDLSGSKINTGREIVNVAAILKNPSELNINTIAAKVGVPTTIAGAAAKLGIPTALPPVNQALKTLGVPTTLAGVVKLSGIDFPKFPQFPGLDMIGIMLGAGPKFIAEQIAKYKLIVPPWIPGLKINMAMALAAISVLKSVLQGNGDEILKHLLSSIVDDIKGQAVEQLQKSIDSTGINDIEKNLKEVLQNAKIQVIENDNKINPPRKILDEEGNVIGEEKTPPDTSQIDKALSEVSFAKTATNSSLFSSTALSKTNFASSINQTNIFSTQVSDTTKSTGVLLSKPVTETTSYIFSKSSDPVSSSSSTQTDKNTIPVPPSPADQYGLTPKQLEGIKKMTRLTKISSLRQNGGFFSRNLNYATSKDPRDMIRSKFEQSAASLEKYSWIYPWEQGWTKEDRWSDEKINYWISFSSDNIPGQNGVPLEW